MCFLAKISLHRRTCKTTFARLTQSQAISQSFRAFISFRSRRDTTFFHFSKLFFIQNYRFLYHGDQKISWWTSMQVAGNQLRNPPMKFRCTRVKVIRVEVSQNVVHARTTGWMTSTRPGKLRDFGLQPRRSNPRSRNLF